MKSRRVALCGIFTCRRSAANSTPRKSEAVAGFIIHSNFFTLSHIFKATTERFRVSASMAEAQPRQVFNERNSFQHRNISNVSLTRDLRNIVRCGASD